MKKLILANLLLVFCACSKSETDEQQPVSKNQTAISGYKITSTTNSGFTGIYTGNLLNEKLFSLTTSITNAGVQQPVTTQQQYFYDNQGRVVKIVKDNRVFENFYDNLGRLIGVTLSIEYFDSQTNNTIIQKLYGRFFYNANDEVICERIESPYNDPNAVVRTRKFLYFNGDKLYRYAFDANLDNVPDNFLQVNYANDNIVSYQKFNGTLETISYSNIIDTEAYLYSKSISIKQQALICFETLGFNKDFAKSISKNLTVEAGQSATYETNSLGYYTKKTEISHSHDAQVVTEYFF